MRVKLLSKRYATAIFDLAVELNILEEVNADLILVKKVFRENRELDVIVSNPTINAHKKIVILDKIFEASTQKLTIKFIKLITLKGREQYIPHICDAFYDIYKDYKNILSVKLTTPLKADKKIADGIAKKLKEATSKNIELTENIDKEIIGGFVINFEDYKYDASIINQLNRLKKSFSDNSLENQI